MSGSELTPCRAIINVNKRGFRIFWLKQRLKLFFLNRAGTVLLFKSDFPHAQGLIDSTRCFSCTCLVQYVHSSLAQFLGSGLFDRWEFGNHRGALRLMDWSQTCSAPRPEAGCQRTVWINWCYTPPHPPYSVTFTMSYSPVHAEIENSRPSTWIVLEGSQWSLPGVTSFWLSYILTWRHCLPCGFLKSDILMLCTVKKMCDFFNGSNFPHCSLELPAGSSEAPMKAGALWSQQNEQDCKPCGERVRRGQSYCSVL